MYFVLFLVFGFYDLPSHSQLDRKTKCPLSSPLGASHVDIALSIFFLKASKRNLIGTSTTRQLMPRRGGQLTFLDSDPIFFLDLSSIVEMIIEQYVK